MTRIGVSPKRALDVLATERRLEMSDGRGEREERERRREQEERESREDRVVASGWMNGSRSGVVLEGWVSGSDRKDGI